MPWTTQSPTRRMGANRLPHLSPGTSQRSSAGVRESRASGDGSRNSLSPRPPRRSGARHEPGAVARHHGNPGDMDAFGTRSPRSRRASASKKHSRTGSVSASPALEAKTVAELLRNRDTRDATLSALEEHATPIDLAVSLAAAPVLNEIRASDTSQVTREEWDRVCLLLARLVAEAGDDAPIVYGTAFGGGRFAAVWGSERTPLAQSLRKPAAELTLEDARSFANAYACWAPGSINSWATLYAAQGVSTLEGIGEMFRLDPLITKCGSCFAATSATSSETQADVLHCVDGAAGRTCLATMRMLGWLNFSSSCSAAMSCQT